MEVTSHKFKVGEHVRMSYKWWKQDLPGYYGKVVSISEFPITREKAYKVRFNGIAGIPVLIREKDLIREP